MSEAAAPPLTVGELLDHLAALAHEEPDVVNFPVTFGPAAEPVAGGIIQRPRLVPGQTYLNLAPIALDGVGGF